MRVNTALNSSWSCVDVKMRCRLWQPTQSGRNDLILSSPGALNSHSAFESWRAGVFLGLDQLDSGLRSAGRDVDRLRAVEIVSGGADADLVVAGLEPVGR